MPAPRRLIINADDFGLTAGVNRAVLELNAACILPSTTLMATGAAFRDAVHGAFMQPTLGVGCHVVLVDGQPASLAADLPTLAPGGRFRSSLATFVRALFAGRISPREIEQEATAQIRRVQESGLTVTHVDSHTHTHIFPGVLAPLLRAAHACQVPAIRNPFEPTWSRRIASTAPAARAMEVRVLGIFHRGFRQSVRRAGLATTDGALGVLATGTLDAETLGRLLRALPSGTWELVCHPGYVDTALQQPGPRLLASREVERAALLQVFGTQASQLPPLELIHFGELTRSTR